MGLLRIAAAQPLEGYRLELQLTDGSRIERDVGALLVGPVFDEVRRSPAFFRTVCVEAGTLAWPNGADLCPDVVIWAGTRLERGVRQGEHYRRRATSASAVRPTRQPRGADKGRSVTQKCVIPALRALGRQRPSVLVAFELQPGRDGEGLPTFSTCDVLGRVLRQALFVRLRRLVPFPAYPKTAATDEALNLVACSGL